MNYSDINLVPRRLSSIESRNEVNTSVTLGAIKLQLPLVVSPMVDCASVDVLNQVIEFGGWGILHRFNTIEEQVEDYKKCYPSVGCAIGISKSTDRLKNDLERYSSLYNVGCRNFCVDVANGFNTNVRKFILSLNRPGTNLIVGNVGSYEGFSYLKKLPNVVAIRCGIAFGGSCATKNQTGVCSPMVSLIKEIYSRTSFSNFSENKIMADGSIKEAQDFCKAIALGANTVMAGSIFAACDDSPAKVIDGSKTISGSASKKIQSLYRDEPKFIEGKTISLGNMHNRGTKIKDVLNSFSEGLKSSMSYFGARNIEEFRDNVSVEKSYG